MGHSSHPRKRQNRGAQERERRRRPCVKHQRVVGEGELSAVAGKAVCTKLTLNAFKITHFDIGCLPGEKAPGQDCIFRSRQRDKLSAREPIGSPLGLPMNPVRMKSE